MVKKLADELTDILNWVENPGLGEHAREEARAGLVIFCRGLVVGLRASEPIEVRGDIPFNHDFAKALAEADRRRRANAERRQKVATDSIRNQENVQRNESMMGKQMDASLRPSDEALEDCRFMPDCN
jgi:hypothetical protein